MPNQAGCPAADVLVIMECHDIIRTLMEIRDPEFLFAQQYLEDAGINLVKCPDEARAFLEARASEGAHEAQLVLSKLLITGLIGDVDRLTAFHLCKRAADAGYAPALVLLSAFYSEGWAGVQCDYTKALSLLHQGADAGYAHAMALLATAYLDGIRGPVDRERGWSYLHQAAECGDANSQYIFGNELIKSEDPQEKTAGVRWILAAANQDLLSAHRQLFHLYAEGKAGLSVDIDRARFHRRRVDDLESDG